RIGVRPICEIYDHPDLAHARCRNLQEVGRGFHDVEPVRIEEVGVISVHLIELRYQGMTLRQSFNLELAYSSSDLSRIKLHRILLLTCEPARASRACGNFPERDCCR